MPILFIYSFAAGHSEAPRNPGACNGAARLLRLSGPHSLRPEQVGQAQALEFLDHRLHIK